MTTLEIETPNDLQLLDSPTLAGMLRNAEDGLASIHSQRASIEETMEGRRAHLQEMSEKVAAAENLSHTLTSQREAKEQEISQARTLAGIATGKAAKATQARVKTLQTDLTQLQQAVDQAALALSSAQTALRVQEETTTKELAQDEEAIEALEQTRSQLEQSRGATAVSLKQAIVREFEEEVQTSQVRIQDLKNAVFEAEFAHNSLRYGIPARFAQYPDLVREMNAKYGDKDKDKPVETPTMRVLKKYLAFLEALRAADLIVGTATGTRPVQGAIMRDLLAIPPHIVDMLLRGNPQAQAWLESRITDLRDWWLKEHEAEAKSGRYVG